jgi:hypothetical protein
VPEARSLGEAEHLRERLRAACVVRVECGGTRLVEVLYGGDLNGTAKL